VPKLSIFSADIKARAIGFTLLLLRGIMIISENPFKFHSLESKGSFNFLLPRAFFCNIFDLISPVLIEIQWLPVHY